MSSFPKLFGIVTLSWVLHEKPSSTDNYMSLNVYVRIPVNIYIYIYTHIHTCTTICVIMSYHYHSCLQSFMVFTQSDMGMNQNLWKHWGKHTSIQCLHGIEFIRVPWFWDPFPMYVIRYTTQKKNITLLWVILFSFFTNPNQVSSVCWFNQLNFFICWWRVVHWLSLPLVRKKNGSFSQHQGSWGSFELLLCWCNGGLWVHLVWAPWHGLGPVAPLVIIAWFLPCYHCKLALGNLFDELAN